MKKQLFIIGIGTLNILHAGFHLLQFVQSALLVSNSLNHNHGFESILHNPYFAVVWAIVGIVTLWIGLKDFKHHKEEKTKQLLNEIDQEIMKGMRNRHKPKVIRVQHILPEGWSIENWELEHILLKNLNEQLKKHKLLQVKKEFLKLGPNKDTLRYDRYYAELYILPIEPKPPEIRNLNHWQ